MNTCKSNQLTSGTNSTSRSPLRHGFVLITLAFAFFALLPAARAQSGEVTSDAPSQCGPGTLKGTYMSEQRGDLNGLPLVQVNRIVSDGLGGITGNGTVVVNGVPTTIPLITATYTVDADCNGTLTSVPAGLSQN